MRQMPLWRLMAVVVASAIALAALRGANEYWAGGLILVTPFILCVSLVDGLYGKEEVRPRRVGFALFGWAYFALAFLGLSQNYLSKLPTSRLLLDVHQRVGAPIRGDVKATTGLVYTFGPTLPVAASGPPKAITQEATFDYRTKNRWKAMIPGAADLNSFAAVGHCLFTIIAGLLGAAIAQKRGRRKN